jgi:hypothetical protein
MASQEGLSSMSEYTALIEYLILQIHHPSTKNVKLTYYSLRIQHHVWFLIISNDLNLVKGFDILIFYK